jgi:hypothetical protein
MATERVSDSNLRPELKSGRAAIPRPRKFEEVTSWEGSSTSTRPRHEFLYLTGRDPLPTHPPEECPPPTQLLTKPIVRAAAQTTRDVERCPRVGQLRDTQLPSNLVCEQCQLPQEFIVLSFNDVLALIYECNGRLQCCAKEAIPSHANCI